MAATIIKMRLNFLLVALVLLYTHGVVVGSDVERQLEKVGTRVGKNEYISVFKESPEAGKKAKTYVLLSKLYMLGPSTSGPNSGDLNEVISYPGGPLKFRRQYIIPAITPTPSPAPAQQQSTEQQQQQHQQIQFPKEESTTRKTAHYNVYNKKTSILASSSPERFPDRKYVIGDGSPAAAAAEQQQQQQKQQEELQQQAPLPVPLVKYLTQLEDGADKNLNPVLAELEGGDGAAPVKEGETLGYYTLITVPRSKKASDGCPTGHRKDHHGICREVFVFGASRS